MPKDLVGSDTSTSGVPLPPKPESPPPADGKKPPPADGKKPPEPAPEPTEAASGGGMPSLPTGSAGGFVLGLMFWSWIALPFLQKGMTGVRDTLRAKFFNKAADGSWLP